MNYSFICNLSLRLNVIAPFILRKWVIPDCHIDNIATSCPFYIIICKDYINNLKSTYSLVVSNQL